MLQPWIFSITLESQQLLDKICSALRAINCTWNHGITHGRSLKFPLTHDGSSGSSARFAESPRSSVDDDDVSETTSSWPWPCDRLRLTTAASRRRSDADAKSALRRRPAQSPAAGSTVDWPATASPTSSRRMSWRGAATAAAAAADGRKTTLSMMRCSARLDLDVFFGSDDDVHRRDDELNGDLIRRRRTPPSDSAVVASATPEVTSESDASTAAERCRRTAAALLTLAMNDDLMDASAVDMVVVVVEWDGDPVVTRVSLLQSLQPTSIITSMRSATRRCASARYKA